MILMHEARQAVAMDTLDLLPQVRSRTMWSNKYRLWEAYLDERKGPGYGLSIYDIDRRAPFSEILLDPYTDPYTRRIREGKDGDRIATIANFIWELPEFMRMIAHKFYHL